MSYMLTHMPILTQGLAVPGPEDVRLGTCEQVEPKGNASCLLSRLILGKVSVLYLSYAF